MRTFIKRICFGLLAAILLQPVLAQQGGNGGGINYAPRPAIYSVLSIDSSGHKVQLRAADGRTGVVYVGEETYDLSKLKPGDKIRVDFVVPEDQNSQLTAASIWPVD